MTPTEHDLQPTKTEASFFPTKPVYDNQKSWFVPNTNIDTILSPSMISHPFLGDPLLSTRDSGIAFQEREGSRIQIP
jgi:hypothetical protein